MRKNDIIKMGFRAGDRVKYVRPKLGEFTGTLFWDDYDNQLYFLRDGCKYADDSSNWFPLNIKGITVSKTTEVRNATYVAGSAG